MHGDATVEKALYVHCICVQLFCLSIKVASPPKVVWIRPCITLYYRYVITIVM